MTNILHSRLKAFFTYCVVAMALLGVTNVAHSAILPEQIEPQEGQSYYTRYNFWVEKEHHVTTNYSRGELIPFNTKVTLESIAGRNIVLDIDGRKITIINQQKHTQRDASAIASELLSPRKISLKGVAGELQDDMQAGIMRLGMTKEQVLMTRGYPPRHKTPSTKANTWVYWSSKFVQRSLVFEKGRLTRGRGLY